MSEPPPGTDDLGNGVEPEPPAPAPAHDPTGLDLARSIADSVGAQQRRRRRRGPTRPTHVDPIRSGAAPDDRDPKPLGSALDHLVEAKGWSTDLSVRALADPLALPGRTDERRPLVAGVLCRHGSHRADGVDGLGHLAARHSTPAGGQAQRPARRRHRHPGQGDRSAGTVLEERAAVGARRTRASGHVRLTSLLSLTRPPLGEEHEETVSTTTDPHPRLGCGG